MNLSESPPEKKISLLAQTVNRPWDKNKIEEEAISVIAEVKQKYPHEKYTTVNLNLDMKLNKEQNIKVYVSTNIGNQDSENKVLILSLYHTPQIPALDCYLLKNTSQTITLNI